MMDLKYVVILSLVLSLSLQIVTAISITGESKNISEYKTRFVITCDVGLLDKIVKWIYRETIYFSCSPPYTDCLTNSSVLHPTYYDFSINITAGTTAVAIYVLINENDGIWTCMHGDDSSILDINIKGEFKITNFYTEGSRIKFEGDVLNFRCYLSTNISLNMTIGSQGFQGDVLLFTTTFPSTGMFTPSATASCTDNQFYCTVNDGLGRMDTFTTNIYVACNIAILTDWTNTTVEATIGTTAELRLYYVGYPTPSYDWHKGNSSNNITNDNIFIMQSTDQTTSTPASIHITIRSVRFQHYGEYIVRVANLGLSQYVVFTLKYPASTAAPTVKTTSSFSSTEAQASSITTTKPTESVLTVSNDKLYIGIGIGISSTLILVAILLVATWVICQRRRSSGLSKKKPSSGGKREEECSTQSGDNDVTHTYDYIPETISYKNVRVVRSYPN